MDATITNRPYEYYAQKELNALATKVGILRAELGIVRCTLKSLLPTIHSWEYEELRDLIARIDDVLST